MNPGRVGSGGAEKDHWGRQHHHHHQCSIGKNGSGGAGVLERRPTSSPPPGGRKSAPSSIAPSEAPLNLERGGEHRRAPVQRFFSPSSKPSHSDGFFHPRPPAGTWARRAGGPVDFGGDFKEEKATSGAPRGLLQRSVDSPNIWSGTGTDRDAHNRGQALQRTTHGASLVPPPPSNALPQ